ncbi:MAG TPA: MFS transporter [Pseudonocardiaceae bacterium]|nr:MFS transporter [Pseudonocardiaceae bacterium]
MATPQERVKFRAVFAVGEFRALWSAELVSTLGDQVARVALAVLVFRNTGSTVLTGLTFALTYLPMLAGGLFLSSLGDRYPRREVMVAANLAQAVLIGAMAVPGAPLWLLCVLLFFSVLATGPFNAAQLALLPDMLTGQRYVTAMSIRNVTTYSSQLVGFAGGGLLIAVLNPNVGLALDAATFAASAVLLRVGVQRRPASAASEGDDAGDGARSLLTGFWAIWRDRRTRTLIAIGGLALFYIAPEALAAPYAAQLKMGTAAVGLLMAADPVGGVVGALVFGRLSESTRLKSVALLGIAAGLPLAVCALRPPLLLALLLFAMSGTAATIYTIQAMTATARLLPDPVRAQGLGFGSAIIQSVQGIGALLAGVLGAAFTPAGGIGAAGALGVLLALGLAGSWRRVARPYDELAAQLEKT